VWRTARDQLRNESLKTNKQTNPVTTKTKTESCCVAQAAHELIILRLPECWDLGCAFHLIQKGFWRKNS
jgi:hypothetical protein